MITISVDGIPVPQGNLTSNQYGAKYDKTKNLKPWRDSVIFAAREAWGGADAWQGPVEVTAVFSFPHLKAHYSTKGVLKLTCPTWVMVRPDLDKLQRSIGDALVLAGCLRDDAQIVHWDVIKVYGRQPGALLNVRAMED